MTPKKAYQQLLLEHECFKHKVVCEHNCKDCAYYNPIVIEEMFCYLTDLVKAKDPMLYLANDLTTLKEVIENVRSKDSET